MDRKIGVLIGRFQMFHRAHYAAVKFALAQVDELLVLLGSCNAACNTKNPWTPDERERMIRLSLTPEEDARVSIIYVDDYLYNDNQWVTQVQNLVRQEIGDVADVTLFGHRTDDSSYYLRLFPTWKFSDTGSYVTASGRELHATHIRSLFFERDNNYKEHVVPAVVEYLEDFTKTTKFKALCDEYHYLAEKKEQWRGTPNPVTFVTVDAMVVKSGHVLLVKRRGSLGTGLLALPGGFLEQHETTLKGAMRELREETLLKISDRELEGALVDQRAFDHPDRSLRGRTITHAFCFNLGAGELPLVKGSDDAAKAFWLPFNRIVKRENEFFEDHAAIIRYFMNRF